MVDVRRVANQVKENCDISDAKHWRMSSVCGLLLRLRDLYRWEKDIEPWGKIDHPELLQWVDQKERNWEELIKKEFQNIEIDREEYPPFDAKEINNTLEPEGFIYGAGFVRALKPSFFLAELEESRKEEGYNIHILGKELARDLVTTPALLQGKDIFARREPMMYLLWDKIEELKTTGKKALKCAFKDYGLDEKKLTARPEGIKDEIDRIAGEELKSYLCHEIGEANDEIFPDEEWHGLIGLFPHTNIEKFVRGVKDILGDTNQKGMLEHIIAHEKKGSLGFYVSSLSGFRKIIFPEIVDGYWEFRKTDDWDVIEKARKVGYNSAKKYAERLIRIYRDGKTKEKEWIKRGIEGELIAPLNL
jgi:hypothetical protein